MSVNLNVFTDDTTARSFKLRNTHDSTHGHQPWGALIEGSRLSRFATRVSQKGLSEECIRGQGPFVGFKLSCIARLATSGVVNIDQYVCNSLAHWRELEVLIGKIHIARGGSWDIDLASRAITIRGACLAFTHLKKDCEPTTREITRPKPWGLRGIVIKEGKVLILP